LSKFESEFRRTRLATPGFLPVVAVLCLLLLALVAFAQVAHTHSNPSDSDHCAVCVVLHTVVPAALAFAAIILIPLGRSNQILKPAAIAHRRRTSSFFIRPPPAGF
jgi:hypothetical protein